MAACEIRERKKKTGKYCKVVYVSSCNRGYYSGQHQGYCVLQLVCDVIDGNAGDGYREDCNARRIELPPYGNEISEPEA